MTEIRHGRGRAKIIAGVGAALLLASFSASLAAGPVPPCAATAAPSASPLGQPPAVAVWPRGSLGPDWMPPACAGWTTPGFRSLIAVSGHFRLAGGMDAVIRRFAAVSAAVGVRYWSVSDKRWLTLISEAQAIDAAGQPRPDFSVDDFTGGGVLMFRQTTHRSGKIGLRMMVRSHTADRLVLVTENTTTVRLLLPLFHPGDLQSLYVIERQPDDLWTYYDLTRVGTGSSSLTDGHDASGVNRAVAWFRHVAGIPTDQEPPAAP